MGVNDFANDDVMITLLDGGCYTAFDRARRIDQKGRSGRAFAEHTLILPSLTSAGLKKVKARLL